MASTPFPAPRHPTVFDRALHSAPWVARWMVACIMLPIIGVSLAVALPDLVAHARVLVDGAAAWSAALVALAVFGTGAWLGRRKRPLPVATFLIATTLLAAGLRVFYSLLIVPEWTNDFLTYWDTALSQVRSGQFVADSFYTERSLPVLVPLAALFGDAPYAVKTTNIAMLGLAQLAGYDILRRQLSHQAAQVFTVGFAAAPIPLFALVIPSHDLWALFFLAVAVWLCAVLLTSKSRRRALLLVGITLALTLVCLLMEVQRGVGTLLALAMLIASILGWGLAATGGRDRKPTRAGMLVLACALALVAQIPLGLLASSLDLRAADKPAQKTHMTAYYATHGTSMGNGTWGWMRAFQTEYTDGLRNQPERLRELSRSLMLSDWAEQPVKRVDNVIHRLDGMYFLDNSNFWYFTNVDPAAARAQSWLSIYSICFSAAFTLLLLLGIARMLLGVDPTTPTLACMAFIAIVSLALASFSENQPRYILWLWLGGMLWLAEMYARRAPRAPISPSRGLALSATALAGWAVLLLGLWAVVDLTYQPTQGRVLGDWTDPATGHSIDELEVPKPADPYVHATQPGELSVALGAGALPAIEHHLCLDTQGPHGLTFFLRASDAGPDDALLVRFGSAPPQHVPLAPTNGKTADIRLPNALQANGCHRLRLELSGSGNARATIDFPRLER